MSDVAARAAKHAGAGLKDVLKGLNELFGGGAKFSSGLTFDDETYAKAKPFFISGAKHFGEAGRGVGETVKLLIRWLAQNGMDREAVERMRPYVRRFMEDLDSGAVNLDEAPAPAAEAKPEPEGQTSMFGEATDKEKAEAHANKPLKSDKAQKDVGGLFGDDAKQTDIADFTKPAATSGPKETASDFKRSPSPSRKSTMTCRCIWSWPSG